MSHSSAETTFLRDFVERGVFPFSFSKFSDKDAELH